MTSDNLIGVIVGVVVFLAGLATFVYADGFTRFARGLFLRSYGEFWAKRANRGFVRVVAGAWIVLGLASLVVGLTGGFPS